MAGSMGTSVNGSFYGDQTPIAGGMNVIFNNAEGSGVHNSAHGMRSNESIGRSDTLGEPTQKKLLTTIVKEEHLAKTEKQKKEAMDKLKKDIGNVELN